MRAIYLALSLLCFAAALWRPLWFLGSMLAGFFVSLGEAKEIEEAQTR